MDGMLNMNYGDFEYSSLSMLVIADDDAIEVPSKSFQVDILVSLGDIHVQTVERIADFCMPERVFAVRGNHDVSSLQWPIWMEDLHGRTEHAHGFKFAGMGGCWRYKNSGAFLFSQDEARSVLKGMPAVDVLISHNSPASYHERDDDVHQGFQAITEYIDRCTPRFVLHGHQHVNNISKRNSTIIIGCYRMCMIEIFCCADHPQPMRMGLLSKEGRVCRKEGFEEKGIFPGGIFIHTVCR